MPASNYLSPNAVNYHAGQAANYVLAWNMENAQTEAADVLRIDHKLSLESWRKDQLYKDQAYLDKLIYAMRKVGLPKTPPLPFPDKPSIAGEPSFSRKNPNLVEHSACKEFDQFIAIFLICFHFISTFSRDQGWMGKTIHSMPSLVSLSYKSNPPEPAS